MSESSELSELIEQMVITNDILRSIADSLDWIAPQESKRERIALQLFIHNPHVEADAAFRLADAWLCELDNQEALQAEQAE